jgi:hypothetical protein
MQAQARKFLRAVQASLTPIDFNLGPLLTGAAQTKLSWARLVESYDELPEIYQSFFDAFPNTAREFPYMVLTPKYEGFIRRENEKLVCRLDQTLHILEKAQNRLNHTSYALEDIHSVEVGMILLKGWITINGISGSGVLTSTTLKFNTVTDRLFAPFLKEIRLFDGIADTADSRTPDLRVEVKDFDYLLRRNFKFMNYARGTILAGETVICSALQPEISAVIVKVFGKAFSRTVATAHILILTDRELIIIEDEPTEPVVGEARYGGIWTYIPLRKITAMSLESTGDNLLNMSVRFTHGGRLDWLFSTQNRPEIDGVLDHLAALAPSIYLN